MSLQQSQKVILERYTNYRHAIDNASNDERDRLAFVAKYQRMAKVRANKLTHFEHQCSKKTCNPMTETQMIVMGMLAPTPRNTSVGSIKTIDPTIYVCKYGTLHACNTKTVPSSWYVDVIPYSPCDLISTHSGEICCQISGLSLGYKQALPFTPSSNKDGSINSGSSNSTNKNNPQEDLYDDLNSYDPSSRLKSKTTERATSSPVINVTTTVTISDGGFDTSQGVEEDQQQQRRSMQLRGPRLRTFSSLPIDFSSSFKVATSTNVIVPRVGLDAFRNIKVNTKNEEQLYRLALDDRLKKDKRTQELDDLKKNAITIKRRKSKSTSNPRCKRSLSNTTGKTKQKRQKQKPKISKLMHEKLSAKIVKKKKQLQREKMREGIVSVAPSDGRQKGIKRSTSEIEFDRIYDGTPLKRRKIDSVVEDATATATSDNEDSSLSITNELELRDVIESRAALEKENGDRLLSYLRFPLESNAIYNNAREGKNSDVATSVDESHVDDREDVNASVPSSLRPARRPGNVFNFKVTQEEKLLRTIVTSLLMDLFYSPKRTDIYNRSTRAPRDRGERAVKSKWAKATKEYKECVKATSNESKRIVAPKPDLTSASSTPPKMAGYVGFNSMTGFTIYRNTVLKFTKIKKTPQLAVNEEFISFFTRHAILQWHIIEKSPYGQSIIKNSVDNKRAIQGDVTLSSFYASTSSSRASSKASSKTLSKTSSRTSSKRTKKPGNNVEKKSLKVEPKSGWKTADFAIVVDVDSDVDDDFSVTVVRSATKSKSSNNNNNDGGANNVGKKQNHGTLSFLGLCLALLYIMRVDDKKVMGRVVVPYCKYVAENIPQIKDLEEYDTKYQCKLITRSTEILKAAYRDMVEKHALHKEDLDNLENVVYKGI